ncbi:MAG TPA: hypothetical protein ENF67_01655 [Candidatus Pacearchaeota archaeon]|nr:hypothetical protein [Candidatus Pacearchaeota archaeon]
MAIEKKPAREIVGKLVVTKEGKKLGMVKDLTFEARSGELIHLVMSNPTSYAQSLNLEAGKSNSLLVPFSAVIAVGDFVVVSEEDIH